MKTCKHCGGLPCVKNRRVCQPCHTAYHAKYYEQHRDRLKEVNRIRTANKKKDPVWAEANRKRGREFWRRLRLEVMDRYGGRVCACCGETEIVFLSIDHIEGNGAEHRRSLGYSQGNGRGGSSRTMQWIKQNGFPPGFQVLCFNCNHGKHVGNGVCPHKACTQTRDMV